MATLNGRYIEDHLVNVHTEESWARAIAEMVLSEAAKQLADKSAPEVVIDAKFRITAVEAVETTAGVRRSPCVRVCVSGPGGRPICFHKPAVV